MITVLKRVIYLLSTIFPNTFSKVVYQLIINPRKKLNKPSNFISNCRSLAFRLYTHCEKIKKAEEALSYNGLIISWAEIERLSAEKEFEPKIQSKLF